MIQEGVRTIEAIRKLGLKGKVVILESDHARGVYAKLDFLRVAQWEKQGPFWEFMHARWINVVVLNDRLREDPRFKLDPEFAGFVDGSGSRGDFEFIPVEGTRVVLAVHRAVLARSADP
jgi:hypothetical protein